MNDFLFSLAAVAGISQEVPAKGDCVAYYEETGGGADVAVVIHAIGGSGGDFVLRPGEQVKLAQVADGFRVENKSGANIIAGSLKIGVGEFTGKNIAGTVTVGNMNGAFVHTAETVTNASGSVLAANANRRYLMIQNRDASGVVYVRTDGAVATAATGIKIGPDEAIIFENFAPTGEITAIGDIASNANVLAVEG